MSEDWTWLADKTWKDLWWGGLIESGMVLEVRDSGGSKRKLLVGDINPSGGVCDDCTGISEDTKVLRWKRVEW